MDSYEFSSLLEFSVKLNSFDDFTLKLGTDILDIYINFLSSLFHQLLADINHITSIQILSLLSIVEQIIRLCLLSFSHYHPVALTNLGCISPTIRCIVSDFLKTW